jgi:hypothetical protein
VDLNTDVIGYIGTSNSPKHTELKKKKAIMIGEVTIKEGKGRRP